MRDTPTTAAFVTVADIVIAAVFPAADVWQRCLAPHEAAGVV